jgi:ribosome-binding protein aMBF1 (putative translation factor)
MVQNVNMIRELREQRMADAADPSDWTQQAVADKLGAAIRSVKAWEAGHSTPRPYMRRRLAKLFGVTPADLRLGG